MYHKRMIESIKSHMINIPGWRTSRNWVVIESDDWGMVRMASRGAYDSLRAKGYPVDACAYNRCDCLESNEDMEALLHVLDAVRDLHGNPAVMTMNQVMGNPDFERIAASGYGQYFVEPFTVTLQRYPSHDRVLEWYRQGMAQGLLRPQFHGREHVHIRHWMDSLQKREPDMMDAFRRGMFSVHRASLSPCQEVFLDAWAIHDLADVPILEEALAEGLSWFRELWGFASMTAVAPCYTWDHKAETVLKACGVVGIQSGRVQIQPKLHRPAKVVRRFNGQRNTLKQTISIRNALFEPTSTPHRDCVSSCLKEIETAFLWKRPAVISTHRLNFIGSIDPKNRDQNLGLFRDLLIRIVRRWPEVEFIASDQLHEFMTKGETHAHRHAIV